MNNYVQPLGELFGNNNGGSSSIPDIFILEGHGMLDPEYDQEVRVPKNTIFITAALCGHTTKGDINTLKFILDDGSTVHFIARSTSHEDVFYRSTVKELLQRPIPSTPKEKLDYNHTLKRLTNSQFNANFPGDLINDGFITPFIGWNTPIHIYATTSGIRIFDDESPPTTETIRSGDYRITRRGDPDSFVEEGAHDSIQYEDVAPLYEKSLYPTQSTIHQAFIDSPRDVSTYDEFNSYLSRNYDIQFLELFAAKERANRGTEHEDPDYREIEENAAKKYGFLTDRPTIIIQPNCRVIPGHSNLESKNERYSAPAIRPPQRQMSNDRNVSFLQELPMKDLLETTLSNGNTYLMDNILLGRDDSVMTILERLMKEEDSGTREEYIRTINITTDTTALDLAINNNRSNDILLALLKAGGRTYNSIWKRIDTVGATYKKLYDFAITSIPLRFAILYYLLDHTFIDINTVSKDIRTKLYLDSYDKNLPIYIQLRERNIDYTIAAFFIIDWSRYDRLPREEDNIKDEAEVKLLLTKGVDIRSKNEHAHTLIYYAINRGFYDIVNILITKGSDGKDIDILTLRLLIKFHEKNAFGIFLLLFATFPRLRQLINARDSIGETLLMTAVIVNNIPVVKLLLQYGADRYKVVAAKSSKVARNLATSDEMRAAINSVKSRSRRNRRSVNKTRKRR
jgi:ankyrin repeat protein